jgi:hypothetical protein
MTASRNSVLQAWHDFAASAVMPPATDILFHNTTADASHGTARPWQDLLRSMLACSIVANHDDRDGDASRDQTVLNRGRARLVPRETRKKAHPLLSLLGLGCDRPAKNSRGHPLVALVATKHLRIGFGSQ